MAYILDVETDEGQVFSTNTFESEKAAKKAMEEFRVRTMVKKVTMTNTETNEVVAKLPSYAEMERARSASRQA